MNHLDRALIAADPLSVDLAALPEAAGQALAQEIRMQPTTRGRSRKRFIVALVAAGLIAIPGTALAAYSGIHSGLFGTGGESVAEEEFLYSDEPGIEAVVEDLTTEFALPSGASYDELLSRYPTADRILVQRTALGQQVSMVAACAWYESWLNGDAAEKAAAQPTINTIPTWPYWVPAGEGPYAQIATETAGGVDTTIQQFITANC